jgi:hypothetical protein
MNTIVDTSSSDIRAPAMSLFEIMVDAYEQTFLAPPRLYRQYGHSAVEVARVNALHEQWRQEHHHNMLEMVYGHFRSTMSRAQVRREIDEFIRRVEADEIDFSPSS